MNVGVSVPLPAYNVDVAFMARTAEALGFESFWCAEHPIMPVHCSTRFPGSADGIVPESYSHFVDPFVALARASGVTTRLKLGTGITLVPERNPLLLAKEISTLDHSVVDDSSSASARAGIARRRPSWGATSITAGRKRARPSW